MEPLWPPSTLPFSTQKPLFQPFHPPFLNDKKHLELSINCNENVVEKWAKEDSFFKGRGKGVGMLKVVSWRGAASGAPRTPRSLSGDKFISKLAGHWQLNCDWSAGNWQLFGILADRGHNFRLLIIIIMMIITGWLWLSSIDPLYRFLAATTATTAAIKHRSDGRQFFGGRKPVQVTHQSPISLHHPPLLTSDEPLSCGDVMMASRTYPPPASSPLPNALRWEVSLPPPEILLTNWMKRRWWRGESGRRVRNRKEEKNNRGLKVKKKVEERHLE